ncbi:MAG: RsmE family RNA methyltransferase [Niabella sp.]
MQLPYFYINEYDADHTVLSLNEDTSRHIAQVLRMANGAQLHLTDGKGHLLTATIIEAHKKHCTVQITSSTFTPRTEKQVFIAISLLKNNNRFEWFLEKATEMSVSGIIPLLCHRTEKEKFRLDRLRQITISAMLQSRQTWLPTMTEAISFEKLIQDQTFQHHQKLIAHCEEGQPKTSLKEIPTAAETIILIGPEGDFTTEEIQQALQTGYRPVSLGNTRLRTETAGVVAAALLCVE